MVASIVGLGVSALPAAAATWGAPTVVQGSGGYGAFTSVSCTGAGDCTAVGNDTNNQPVFATETGGTWGTVHEIPGAPNGWVSFSGVSCTAAGDCTAVGYSYADGSFQPIYATEAAGSWGTVQEVTGSTNSYSQLSAVNCTGAGDCTAVGSDGGEPMYTTETSGSWATPTDVGAPGGGQFSGVSCTGATDCTAVGYDYNSLPISATETDGTWAPATEVSDSAGDSGSFSGVSCTGTTASTACTAVGNDGNGLPIYATEAAGIWGSFSEVSVTPGDYGRFSAVSCTDATDCTAVGSDSDPSGNELPVYVTEAGGTWGPPTDISNPPGGSGRFVGVSCTATTDCTAVAETYSHQPPLYATETAGTWGPINGVPGSGGSGSFNGVSCTAAGDCTAVGNDENGQPTYATEKDGTWGAVQEVPGQSGFRGQFSAVSCTDAGDCTAVGYSNDNQPVYVTEKDGTWGSLQEVLGSPGGYGRFYAVSCTDSTDCTAVGDDPWYSVPPTYATEKDGIWSSVQEVSPTGNGSLSGVSCTAAGDCTAVGTDSDSLGHEHPIYVTETSGAWGTVHEVAGSTSADDFNSFSGVSCTDATDCTAVGDDYFSRPIYATETAGSWGDFHELPAQNPYGRALFSAVSCTDPANCTAVGADAYSGDQPLYATETAGTWGTPTDIPNSPSNGGQLNAVSCTDAADCTAAGTDSPGPARGAQPIYATETGLPQTVSFTSAAPTGAVLGGSYLASASSSSGLPVVLSVDASSVGICAITSGHGSSGTVSFIGLGRCVIDANQKGDQIYQKATQQQSFQIGPAPLTITGPSLSVMWNNPTPTLPPVYSGLVNGDTATTTPAVCTTTATVSSLPGSYTTSCHGAADPNYLISYVTGTLKVTPPSVSYLQSLVTTFSTDAGVSAALKGKLTDISAAPNAQAKAGKVKAFDNQVTAQTGKSLTTDQGSLLEEGASLL